MKNIVIGLLVLFVATSCVTARKCNAKFPMTSTVDSIYTEIVKEVPVYLPGDTINFEVPIDCPDQNVYYENTKLRQDIRILNRRLSSKTTIKPDTVKIYVKDTKTVIKEVKVPQPVKYIPKRFKTYRNIVFFIFALAFIWTGYKGYTFFKK